MPVIALIEHDGTTVKKASNELVSYAARWAAQSGDHAIAVILGTLSDKGDLANYGAAKIVHMDDSALDQVDPQQYVAALRAVMTEHGAEKVVLAHSSTGKSISGILAVQSDAALIHGINALPEEGIYRRGAYSGKALAYYKPEAGSLIITLMGNSVPAEKIDAAGETISMSPSLPVARLTRVEVKTVDGDIPLPEASKVVSAGRGMKGPENWGIVEELAAELHAATACSRPVADTGWRPHHEHVGQTGVAIRPNLYIAIGISGAIQHLAGVNNSKTIVVINKDPEAPFFKAADYGVLGDLFDVVPRLTQAIRDYKQS